MPKDNQPQMFYLFISAVVGIDVYAWYKLHNAFLRGKNITALILLVAMLVMLFMPALLHLIYQHKPTPNILELAGWIWLSIVLWLFTAFLCCDIWNLVAKATNYFLKHNSNLPCMPFISPSIAAYIALIFTIIAIIWGTIEANLINFKHVNVECANLPTDKAGYKIALISDIHLGSASTWYRTNKIIRLLNQEKPDMLLSAGDFVDGHNDRVNNMAELFNKLAPPDGKYAVYGNHDVYSGIDFSHECHTKSAGFTMLENNDVTPLPWLYIYGENDPAKGIHPSNKIEKKQTSDITAPADKFSILLKHRPDTEPQCKFNLQLSGHSHGGQIFPFTLLVRTKYPYKEGILHKISSESYLYVSPGTGVWGMPFRFLAPPEITILILNPNTDSL